MIVTIPATVYFALRRSETGPVEDVPSAVDEADGQSGGEEVPPLSQGAETEFGEFALLWQGEGGSEHLALGKQAEYFPFGTSLAPTEPEEAGHAETYRELHRVDCGDLKLQYFRWEEESGPVESVYEITTIVPGYGTPRGIQVGSRETEVLEAYGDELIYHLKEDSYTVAPHDDYYTYATPWDGCEIAFFIQKGEVAALRLRLLLDVGFEGPDNLYSFPVVDGEPDFSAAGSRRRRRSTRPGRSTSPSTPCGTRPISPPRRSTSTGGTSTVTSSTCPGRRSAAWERRGSGMRPSLNCCTGSTSRIPCPRTRSTASRPGGACART